MKCSKCGKYYNKIWIGKDKKCFNCLSWEQDLKQRKKESKKRYKLQKQQEKYWKGEDNLWS